MRARILIVDDDHAYVAGVTEYLDAHGFEVIAAQSFEDAKRALATSGPQLVIVDVRLGAFNGLQLLSTGRVKVPAIVVTGFDDPVLRAEAAAFGAQYLVKPIVPSALLTLVQQLLASVSEAR
jgi:DNA-binding response OmpR family regulator